MRDKSHAVQKAAIEALGSLGDASVVNPLIATLIANRELVSMQRAIVAALLEIGDSAVEPLIAALTDDHEVARIVAAEVLGELGDSRAEDPLTKLLSQVELGRQTTEASATICGNPRSERSGIRER